jgi:putative nucleotidyltransferase with HDIG domain
MLVHIADRKADPVDLSGALGVSLAVRRASLDDVGDVLDLRGSHLLIDADLVDLESVRKLKALLPAKTPDAIWIFVCDPGSRVSEVRAGALGATKILTRPVNEQELLRALGLIDPAADATNQDTEVAASSVGSGGIALKDLFGSLLENRPFVARELADAAGSISAGLDEAGVNRWLVIVRKHHTGTYQHCLLVTGVATAFAKKLGLSRRDTETMTLAGLVHDVGKARIPLAILDKPGKLTAEEFAVMKMHPVYAHDFLVKSADLDAEVVAAARHHHEYLDGSGYPDRLAANQIRDVTRILTIADVFGALIEKRSYKPPLPAKDAYAILEGMAERGLLERPLVAAFRTVAGEIA